MVECGDCMSGDRDLHSIVIRDVFASELLEISSSLEPTVWHGVIETVQCANTARYLASDKANNTYA